MHLFIFFGGVGPIQRKKLLIFWKDLDLGPYSLTWIKLSEKSAQDQIKENGSADLWLKSVFTKEGSAEPKILKNFT